MDQLGLGLDDDAGTNGTAAFTDSEAEALLDSDWGDQLDLHVDVIAGHAHLGALGQGDDASDVGGTEVELRTIVVEERGVTAALVLVQDVNLTNKLGEGVNGTGLGQNLAALDLVLGNTTQQGTDVITSLGVVEQLVEHFDTGDDGLATLVGQTDDLDFLAELQLATLNTAGSDGTTTGDREDVLNGHQERLVGLTVGRGDPGIDSVHELVHALVLGSVDVLGLGDQGVQSAAADDRGLVAREAVEVEHLADFHLDELKQLFIVDLVALVQENENGRHVDLTGEQQVLTSLGHGAVGSGDDQDSAVHLSSAGDHVLDIVGVARAVDVGIVTALNLGVVLAGLVVVANAVEGLVLNVSGVDGDTTLALFRSLIDGAVIGVVSTALHGEELGDRGGQGGLTMVDMTDGTNVYVGLGTLEFLLSH